MQRYHVVKGREGKRAALKKKLTKTLLAIAHPSLTPPSTLAHTTKSHLPAAASCATA